MSILKDNYLRIGILGSRGFPGVQGGVETHCENLSLGLVALGCDVIAFVRKQYFPVPMDEYKGVRLVSLPTIRQKHVEAIIHTFLGVLSAKRLKVDVLHFHALGSALCIPLARILGMKVVFTSHGSNYRHLKWGRLARLVLKLSEKIGVVYCHKLITISEFIASELREKYGKVAEVIPNGVTIPSVVTSTNILGKFALTPGGYILVVGRLVRGKGLLGLVDAFVRTGLTGYKLVIVGGPDHKDNYLREITCVTERNSDICLTGVLTGLDLQEIFTHAALFVQPSFYEGLPIALLEALTFGLSCVASDIPGNKGLGLANNRYFKAGDSNELSAKIVYFIRQGMTNQQKHDQIAFVRENFNWSSIAEQTLSVYRKAVCQV